MVAADRAAVTTPAAKTAALISNGIA